MFGWSEDEQSKAIRYCLKRKVSRYMLELDETQQEHIKEIEKKTKILLVEGSEFQGLLEKGLPGLEKTIRDKLLRFRLLAVAPENFQSKKIFS